MKTLREIVRLPATWASIVAWGLGTFVFNEGTVLPLWGCILTALGVVIAGWLLVGWIFWVHTA